MNALEKLLSFSKDCLIHDLEQRLYGTEYQRQLAYEVLKMVQDGRISVGKGVELLHPYPVSAPIKWWEFWRLK